MTSEGSFIDVGGIRTFHYDEGSGDVPVVCLHGNPDTADSWRNLLDRAGGQLGRVIAPDIPGWGRSPAPDRARCDGSLDALSDWFAEFLDTLDLGRFHLVVHDWGSLALSAASRRPADVVSVSIMDIVPLSASYHWHWIATWLWRPRWGELTMPLLGRPVLDGLTRLQRPGFKGYPSEWLTHVAKHLDRDTKDSILRLYRSADPDVLGRHGAQLGQLTCPSLLMWGDKDPYTPIRYMDGVADQLGSDPERATFPGAGHWVMLDEPGVFDRIAALVTA